jgi:hypothetical protein
MLSFMQKSLRFLVVLCVYNRNGRRASDLVTVNLYACWEIYLKKL